MDKYEEPLIEYSKKQIQFVTPYPSVARRQHHATKRALEAHNVEGANEVGVSCRELLNDYANQIYSSEYSEMVIKR